MVKWKQLLIITAGILLLNSIAINSYADTEETRTFNTKDPYEPFNRVVYRFNDLFDTLILKPVSTFYNIIVPKPIAKGISNIFSNMDTIPTVANDILQFNIYQAASDAWRLAINTTIGIGGFFDPASALGLEYNYEDLGLTFARWGWENSNYLVLPFIGPSSVRDGLAWFPNYQYLTVWPYINPVSARYQVYITSIVSKRAELLRYETVMEQAALDKYIFIRNAFKQRRAYLIDRNKRLGDPYLANNNSDEKDDTDSEEITDNTSTPTPNS